MLYLAYIPDESIDSLVLVNANNEEEVFNTLLNKYGLEVANKYTVEPANKWIIKAEPKKESLNTIILLNNYKALPKSVIFLKNLAAKYHGVFKPEGKLVVNLTTTELNNLLGELKDKGYDYILTQTKEALKQKINKLKEQFDWDEEAKEQRREELAKEFVDTYYFEEYDEYKKYNPDANYSDFISFNGLEKEFQKWLLNI